jgi:hypothetical protein
MGIVRTVTIIDDTHGSEFIMFDLHHIIRSINMRSYLWSGIGKTLYRELPFASLSQDGSMASTFHRVILVSESASTQYKLRSQWGMMSNTTPFVTTAPPAGSATLLQASKA